MSPRRDEFAVPEEETPLPPPRRGRGPSQLLPRVVVELPAPRPPLARPRPAPWLDLRRVPHLLTDLTHRLSSESSSRPSESRRPRLDSLIPVARCLRGPRPALPSPSPPRPEAQRNAQGQDTTRAGGVPGE